MEATADDEHKIVNHVTDLQDQQLSQFEAEAEAATVGNDEEVLPTSHQDAETTPGDSTSLEAAATPEVGAATSATGLATPATKRRRYRSLFGNIGKLITFNRRKQEQPTSPSAPADPPEESELQFPPADTVSLDLIVPDTDTSSGSAEDPISGQVRELETPHSPADSTPTTAAADTEPLEPQESQEPQEDEKEREEKVELAEQQEAAGEQGSEGKKKMEYDMSMGGIATILEETEEAVKAQEGELFTEADLIKLESEIDLADFSNQARSSESGIRHLMELDLEADVSTAAMSNSGAKEEKAPVKDTKVTGEGKKTKNSFGLQNQISESDSGYGHSTSDSPVEVEVEKPEKPQEVEGSNGGSDVFAKEIEDTLNAKSTMKRGPLISPSEEELASFEKAEVCVQDSMVDLGDISVKLDSLIESNSPDRLSRTDETPEQMPIVVKTAELGRVSESLEDEDDEEIEPVELDLSSNQAVRRRKFMDAKARRQKELQAARKLQEEAMSGAALEVQECPKSEARVQPETPVKDRDIVDGLGPRRHSHENNACIESSETGRSRMMSRLPVRRSASCPRRAVEDYSTYIRSGSAGKKPPIPQLVESSYNPVKIDFRPLSRTAPEPYSEQLTHSAQQPNAGCDTKHPVQAVGQTGKRGSKKVHFNSPTVDQVVTYAAATVENEEMRQKDGEEENGQQLPVKLKQLPQAGSGARVGRQKAAPEPEKLPSVNEDIRSEEMHVVVQKTIVARSPIYNCAKSWLKVLVDNEKDRSLIKSISVKQTLASRKRLEKLHEDAVKQLGLQDESLYMTPLQRKDLEMKELKRQLDEAYFVIEQRELELDVFHHEKVKSIDDAVKDREEKIACLQVQISQLESDFACLRSQHGDICKREKNLAESLDQLRTECAERERRHQDLYLEMYRKGRDSAKFERQDEIEKLAVLEPDKVAMEELLEKLEITQHDLQKWQSIKLKEVYEDSDKSGTEADAKLRFLRDSMFHYLTEKDREQNQQHLMAMIGIFSFTDVQMKHIMKSLDERRKKGKI